MPDPPPIPRDPACPWCGHSHHWLPCDDCPCPPHPNYPGDF